MSDLLRRVQEALTDDLRRPPWRGDPNPLAGHCYVASEALFHLLGGSEAGWKAYFIKHEGQPHWFLRHQDGRVLDPTASQFDSLPTYEEATGKGFLTRHPSKRAREVITRVADQDPSR